MKTLRSKVPMIIAFSISIVLAFCAGVVFRGHSDCWDAYYRGQATGSQVGWYCDNCKSYHAPDVKTCPRGNANKAQEGK